MADMSGAVGTQTASDTELFEEVEARLGLNLADFFDRAANLDEDDLYGENDSNQGAAGVVLGEYMVAVDEDTAETDTEADGAEADRGSPAKKKKKANPSRWASHDVEETTKLASDASTRYAFKMFADFTEEVLETSITVDTFKEEADKPRLCDILTKFIKSVSSCRCFHF
jgi:hypothetical protein